MRPLLEKHGHDVVAVDLPCDDPSADFATYADVVCAALDAHRDDVVVVGHSLGGLTIPLVAARRPVRHLVYVCALLPAVGRSWEDQFADEPEMMCPGWNVALDVDDRDCTFWSDPDLTRALLYDDCDEETAAAAFARLRPQAPLGSRLFPLAELPSVSCTSVVCAEDRMLCAEWAKRAAARLGAELVELPGGHSPMLSRPSAFADALLRVAER